jgi:hypothetical protein
VCVKIEKVTTFSLHIIPDMCPKRITPTSSCHFGYGEVCICSCLVDGTLDKVTTMSAYQVRGAVATCSAEQLILLAGLPKGSEKTPCYDYLIPRG